MQKNNKTFELQNQLKEFGLNPISWELNKKTSEEYLIISKEDPEFIFYGTTDARAKQKKWKKLQLLSL